MDPFARDLLNSLLEKIENDLESADDEGDRSSRDQGQTLPAASERARCLLERALLAAADDDPDKAEALRRDVLNRIAKNLMHHPEELLLKSEWKAGWKSLLAPLVLSMPARLTNFTTHYLTLAKLLIAQHITVLTVTTVGVTLMVAAIIVLPGNMSDVHAKASPTASPTPTTEELSLSQELSTSKVTPEQSHSLLLRSTSASTSQPLQPTSAQSSPYATQTHTPLYPTSTPTQQILQPTSTPTQQHPTPTPSQPPERTPIATLSPPQPTQPQQSPPKPQPTDSPVPPQPAPSETPYPCTFDPLPKRCDDSTRQPDRNDGTPFDTPQHDRPLPQPTQDS